MRILLVEDDHNIAEVLAHTITSEGYVVDQVFDGEEAYQQIHLIDYDLIILDVGLPKLNGFNLCKKLRSENFGKPILFLTGCDTKYDEIQGLDLGADDYLVKPVDILILLARIRVLLRRKIVSSPLLKWDGLTLDPTTYEVIYHNKILNLTPKEYAILELLMRNGNKVLSRSVILEHIWSYNDPPSEYTVKTHLNSLRKKLEKTGAPKDFIMTIHSRGYCLNTEYLLDE